MRQETRRRREEAYRTEYNSNGERLAPGGVLVGEIYLKSSIECIFILSLLYIPPPRTIARRATPSIVHDRRAYTPCYTHELHTVSISKLFKDPWCCDPEYCSLWDGYTRSNHVTCLLSEKERAREHSKAMVRESTVIYRLVRRRDGGSWRTLACINLPLLDQCARHLSCGEGTMNRSWRLQLPYSTVQYSTANGNKMDLSWFAPLHPGKKRLKIHSARNLGCSTALGVRFPLASTRRSLNRVLQL